MKRSALGGQSASFARSWKLALLASTAMGSATLALASPQGGEVVQGSAAISNPTTATTQIDQSSDKAIINWQSFNVGAGEKAIFNQPSATSVTLNRIFDQDPSIVAGLVTANGRLILINANGLVFADGATVNTAGLIATTADISNSDFMVGNYRFDKPGAANASIVNNGMITAEEGGVVAFVAPSVRNSGVITAKLGRVALGAGNTFVLDLYGDNLISFPVSAEIAQQLVGPDGKPLANLIDVAGKIDAGSVQLSARAARGIIDNVINVDGEIIASGIKQSSVGSTFLTGGAFNPDFTQDGRAVAQVDGAGGRYGGANGTYGGRIVIDSGANGVSVGGVLNASGAQGGSVSVAGSTVAVRGTIDATGAKGRGGDVSISGNRIALSGATIDASGATGGGTIAVGYSGEGAARAISADTVLVSQDSTLRADARDSGDGGRVVLWSNKATEFYGSVSARGGARGGDGGFMEVSSKGQVGFSGSADASAAKGKSGMLTLDPKDIIISTAGSGLGLPGLTDPNQLTFGQSPAATLTVNPDAITATLNTGTAVTLQANNDLTVASNIVANNPFGAGGDLTLQAGRSVFINADITTDGGDLTILANELLASGVVNAQRDPGSAVISMGVGADIDAGQGHVRMAILSGAGKTNTASGDITLRNVTAGQILIENLGPSNGDVVLASGALAGTDTILETPLIVAAQGGDFVNNAGAGALATPGGGRWLVYSQGPSANTAGGLVAAPYYNTPYNPADPTGVEGSGNRFAYTLAPVLTVTPGNASREYGEANPDFTYTITGLLAGDTLEGAVQGGADVFSLADQLSSVAGGPYVISAAIGSLTSDYNYGFAFGQGALTITPVQLTYLANIITQTYGDINLDDVDGRLIGIKNNEALDEIGTGDPTFVTGVTETTGVGVYGISGAGFTVTSSNYMPLILQAPTNATAFTIVPAQLFYNADDDDREYGDDNPIFDGDLEGIAEFDTFESVVSGTLVFTSAATATSNVGIYSILGSGLTVINPNYELTILQDDNNLTALTITPATLTYVANSASRLYGDPNPIFSGTVSGLKNADTLESVTDGTLVFLSPATIGSSVGEYGIYGEGLTVATSNYFSVIEQDADNDFALEINPVQLFYMANHYSRVYGQSNPTLTGTVTGLKNGDTLESVTTGTLVWTPDADEDSDVGVYAIEGGGLGVTSPNYLEDIEQSFENSFALTITPAQLFYLADPQSRLFGFPNPAFTGDVIGLLEGDDFEDVLDGILTFSTLATPDTLAGKYAINGSGLSLVSTNYFATILQDPSNATALTIHPISLNTIQAQGESANGNESAVDQDQNDMTSRPSELGIVGVGPVSDDMSDGQNDNLVQQLCVLNVPEAAAAPGCVTPRVGQ